MPKPNKQVIIDAIVKEVEKGKAYTKVLGVFGSKWGIPPTTFDRYWKTVNEQHAVKQESIKKELSAIDIQTAIDARKSGLKSKTERLMTLQQQYEACLTELKAKKLSVWDKIALRKCYKELQSEISKMEGDYAPTKVANTDVEGNYVPPFTDRQVDKIVFSLSGHEN